MKNKKNIFISIFLTLIFFICACENEIIKPEKLTIPDVVKFSTDVKSLFESKNCTSCHSDGGSNIVQFTFTNLKNNSKYGDMITKPAADSKLIKVLNKTVSHVYAPINFTADEILLISKWIDAGPADN